MPPERLSGGGASVGHGRLDTRSSTRRQPARIVAAIHYNRQSLFVRHVVTHASTTFGRGRTYTHECRSPSGILSRHCSKLGRAAG
nr:type II toxin-antitoxin system HigB family toxin [Paraburkholderia kirstenboschensis]